MSATPMSKAEKGSKKRQTKNTQRAKMEAREANILSAATQVFAESGFDGTRMAEIARRAEVAEGTLYLYYRNKQELLEGVVGRFWQQLTDGAESAIDTNASASQQLRELASYHLQSVLDQYEVVALTYRARQRHGEPEFQLEQIRDYVRVFDHIVQRGIDRGELMPDLPLWQSRDVFFGTLEFSARTLRLHDQGFDVSVVSNLMRLFNGYLTTDGTKQQATPQRADISLEKHRNISTETPPSSAAATNTPDIEERLARIEAQLEQLLKNDSSGDRN